MTARVVVAGVGNLFLTDDGFGTEVTRRMASEPLPPGVRVTDFGAGAVHLAYELMEGCELLVLVDAAPRGGEPGSLYIIEPELPAPGPADRPAEAPVLDPHSLTPDGVLHLMGRLGPAAGTVRVVGCEPASVEEGIGLTPAVEAAVDEAIRVVRRLVDAVVVDGDGGEERGAEHARARDV